MRPVIMIVLVGCVVFSSVGVGAVSAQTSEPISDATDAATDAVDDATNMDADTDTDAADGDERQREDPAGVSINIDGRTMIDSYDYDSDNQTLTVSVSNRGDGDARLIMAEVIEQGADRMAFRDFDLAAGESREILLKGIEDQGGDPAVMVATDRSLEDRRIEWIPTGDNPLAETVSLTEGLGIGISITILMTAVMAYRKRTKSGDSPDDPFDDSGVIDR